MRYVGITGFASRAEVDACLAALPEGLTLMCGVLVSAATFAGLKNRWWKRYPLAAEIADIFSPDPRCLNLIHYCADLWPSAAAVSQLKTLGGEHCHGFQFNGVWPEPSVLRTCGGIDVVLQLRPSGRPGDVDRLRAAVAAMPECRVHVLVDGSGGRGVPIDPDIADAWAMTIRGHFGNDVGLGLAGGLDAEALPRIASEIRTWGASIDAEGRLRDGDEGGTLNLDKARAYLRTAGEIFGGGR